MNDTTIDITPCFNMELIERYADEKQTRDPQTHITARLEVLAEFSDLIDELEGEYHSAEEKLDFLTTLISKRHREASQELLSWFAP